MAQDASMIPGWDKVVKLADSLLSLDGYVTNRQADQIKQLYHNLEEVDKKSIAFTPKYKQGKGRFHKKKKSGHVGTDSMAR